ncbi:hypothetical protein R5R35_012863 [Gryllus longicercus]|uniref:C-type lectin domain-containing protein n=1 Tax=Gryllus longicercus TaxID=2509291 RepID=A0AAN9VC83_9ORTH
MLISLPSYFILLPLLLPLHLLSFSKFRLVPISSTHWNGEVSEISGLVSESPRRRKRKQKATVAPRLSPREASLGPNCFSAALQLAAAAASEHGMIVRSALVLAMASALSLAGAGAGAESCAEGPSPPGGEGRRPRPARSPDRRRGRFMSWDSEDGDGVPAPMPSPCELPPPCPPRGFAPFPPTVGFYRPHAAPARWQFARQLCLKDDAHLALPSSQIEVKVLIELMKMNNMTSIYVGFYKTKKGEYFSVLGKKMSEKEAALWNVARHSPEDSAECVALDAEGFAPSPCDALLPFVCEL